MCHREEQRQSDVATLAERSWIEPYEKRLTKKTSCKGIVAASVRILHVHVGSRGQRLTVTAG